MTPVQSVPDSFEEIFCAQYGVPPDLYGVTVLRLTLYPHARWLAEIGPRTFLAPDRSFIASVGRLTRWRGFAGEVQEFQHLPENRRFWRRRLRLRISVARMRVLFSEVMGGTPAPPRSAPRSLGAERSEPDAFVMDSGGGFGLDRVATVRTPAPREVLHAGPKTF